MGAVKMPTLLLRSKVNAEHLNDRATSILARIQTKQSTRLAFGTCHALQDRFSSISPVDAEIRFRLFLESEFTKQNIELCQKDLQVLRLLYSVLHRFMSTGQMREIFAGAHVVLRNDGGDLYRKLSGTTEEFRDFGPYERGSSHYSKDQTYGVVLGKVLRTILTGTTREGDSWFQMEGAPWGKGASIFDCVEHAYDYLRYKFSGFNQGPLGQSNYTEANPLIVDVGN